MAVSIILIILIIIILIIKTYFMWAFNYWKRKGVKAPSASFPFGNATKVFVQNTSLGELLKNIYLEKKAEGWKYCGFYFLAKPTFMVFDLELIKLILTKDFSHFTGHGVYMNEEDDPVSATLLALKGQKWRQFRTKLTPSFSVGKVKMMFQNFLDSSDKLVNVMDTVVKKQDVININDIAMRYAIDVIGSSAFGIECNTLTDPHSEFHSYAKKIIGEENLFQHFKNVLALTVPSLLSFFHIPLNSPDVSKFFLNLVKDTIKYREENNIIRKDFMHLLIQLKNNVTIEEEEIGQLKNKKSSSEEEEKETMTVKQMAAQALIFYVGGYETSSTTISFFMFEMANNQEIQETLRKEIIDILAKHKGRITYEALTEMTYLDKCVIETLRKHPPLPILMRECTQSYKIPNSEAVIDKGTTIFIPILGIHHNPEYYPNPEIFDPERFNPENKSKLPNYSWLPFGEGPRICIGLKFGLIQIKVAVTTLLKNYKFTLNPKTKLPLVIKPSSVFLSVKEGIWLDTEEI